MSDSRQKLLGRFRAVLLNRVREVRGALAAVAADPGAEELLKRELHTFKGESRMLGLTVQSELAHTLEGRLPLLVAAPSPEREKLRGKMIFAIDAVARSLDEGADAEQVEIELSEAVMALESDGDLPASAGAEPPQNASTPAQAPEAAEPATPARPSARGRWTQIEASAIDRLCERMTELSSSYAELQAHAVRVFGAEVLAGHRERFLPLVEELERCKSSLDECTVNAWSLRLVAVEPTLVELGRHAESIAKSIGKPIDVRIDAAGVQLESDVLDQLWDSLLHLVQNAVEHGIERPGDRADKPAKGTIVISAESTGPSVVLGVEDDGRGIDPDQVRDVAIARGIVPATTVRLTEMELLDVLCRQGFTTKASVTALSGRGVGLDVVRSKVESLGGSVRVESWPGLGTRFHLHVPFAITKERMLVVEAGDMLLGIPTRLIRTVMELGRVEEGQRRSDVLKYRDEILPLRSLAAVLGLTRTEETVALVMDVGARHWAIAIPRALGERDLIRTPADPLLLRTSPIGATALLEDGRLVFVPQLDHLLRLLRAASDAKRAAPTAPRRRRVLVVDDSPVIRDLVTEVLTSVGLEVTLAADGALGLRSVEVDEPDLVLSDVEMPNMDGFEMLRQIRTRTQRLPVVMLTTRGSIEDRKRASSLGANAYLVKSEFEGGALVEVIGRFLDLTA